MTSSKRQYRARRRFSPEQKADVVRLIVHGGESIAQGCQRLDLSESAVRKWVKQAQVDAAGGTADALSTEERQELWRLRREVKRLTMERRS